MTDRPPVVGPSVLVVDDEPGPRLLVARTLRRAGYEVVEADAGVVALQIIDAEGVGLVICDLGMPDMSGIELVETLRGRPETATLPVILMTGSGDDQSVIRGLGAGADDFLAKPVRLDELVARVRAHLRIHAVWSQVLKTELTVRSGVVEALGSLQLSAVPEETAVAVVGEIARRTDSDFVSVAQVDVDQRMQELATFNRRDGLRQGGDQFPADLAAYLLGRARTGPWVEEVRSVGIAEPTAALEAANLDQVANAPIFAGDDLVGLLSIGVAADASQSTRIRQAKLLAAAIDYASVLSAVAGSSIAGRRAASAMRAGLQGMLERREFHMVFQPIVDVLTRRPVGFEALARFDDGERPDVRFAEAAKADLGLDFELAAIRMAVGQVDLLPADTFLSLNVSPRSVIEGTEELRALLATDGRAYVVELTEHVPIDDYAILRATFEALGPHVRIAVDDAGAGFASMRHILELQPAFAKLDISLVRGIDGDDMRQSLAAGLNYYAIRTGCRLIAEGVETEAEAAVLQRLGVELAQGYLFGRPEPIGPMVQ